MCHVLVIEDDWLIAEHLTDLIERAGGTSIATATTQAEAVAQAAERVPAIILSDVNLLEGTGPLAVQTIQEVAGPVPVIFITGTPQDCKPCAPPAIVLGKPINERLVIETFLRMAPL